jgi:multisubunit Na+/H+ antiporter MnhC subunit
MKLTSDIKERHAQAWVLVGLLIISTGVYLGFDYSAVFVYLGIGIICTVYGLALFVFLILDGPRKSNIRPLSRNFISIGATVIMPAPQADQEPTSRQ